MRHNSHIFSPSLIIFYVIPKVERPSQEALIGVEPTNAGFADPPPTDEGQCLIFPILGQSLHVA